MPGGESIGLNTEQFESLIMGGREANGPNTLSQFWNNLEDASWITSSELSAAGSLFQQYGVSAKPVAFDEGQEFTLNNAGSAQHLRGTFRKQ